MKLMHLREDDLPEQPQLEQPDPSDPAFANLQHLARAKEIEKLAAQDKVHLFGRKPNGAYFRIPGVEQVTAQLSRMLDQQLAQVGEDTMEDQYEELRSNVELVATGKSNFAKSLLITGAPSAGKSFNVMQVIKKLGLSDGKDFVLKKGRITDTAMYRTLIEQVNGMIIFDDCDSVVDTKDGTNMLKAALDTDAVREISYDVRGMLNTATLSFHERAYYVEALSNVLRNQHTDDDIAVIETTFYRMRLLNKVLQDFQKDKRRDAKANGSVDDQDYVSTGGSREDVILEYARTHLPNKFDFKGRIIFISNMKKDQWDSAILTRAFHQDMQFKSDEMLDFIERICDKMPTPGLSHEDKIEVLNYLRQLWQTGKINVDINFRIVQQAWDLRLVPGWKKKIARW